MLIYYRLENTQVALCAHFLHMSFDMPFDEFLPETVPINLAIQVSGKTFFKFLIIMSKYGAIVFILF